MKRIAGFAALALLTAFAGCGAEHMSGLSAVNLLCEYRTNPVIDTPVPRLSWQIRSERRGVMQSAYQILVSSSPEALAKDSGDLWDSGRVTDGRSVNVLYQGASLGSRARCWWKVRVWDGSGAGSTWSDPASFDMALLSPGDWQAAWIGDGRPDPESDSAFFRDDPAPLFRRQFRASGQVIRAVLYITGLGYYEASLNGERIGDSMLDPGWTTYSRRVLYAVHDVTAHVRQGENVLGVTLGNGWYNPLPMRMWGRLDLREHLTVGRPRFVARLEIQYADGATDTVVTDNRWKTAEGPILRNNVFLGEVYDARREITGWNRPGFDDSGWDSVHEAEAPGGELRLQAQPPIRATEVFEHLRYTEPRRGVFIFDMGRNFGGLAGIRVKGPAGTRITMRYGELLNPDGTLNVMTSTAGQIKPGSRNQPEGVPIPACQSDTYILRGDASENYLPRFTFRGFRYVEITGAEGESTIDGVYGVRMNADVRPCGSFECSSPLLNSIQDMTLRTFLSNLFSVQSDCPHREKFGYGGDVVPTCEAFMFNFDMSSMYPKIVRDFADAARGNGGLTETAPYVGIADRGFGDGSGPVGWTLAHPYLLERLYRFYGDERLMSEQYETLKRLVVFIRANTPDNIVGHGIGDHESIDPKDEALTGTAFYYAHVSIIAWMARELGYDEDAADFDALKQDIARAFAARFGRSEGVYGNGMQAAQATALHYGLTDHDRDKAFERLVAEIERRERHLSTGIFGTKFMLGVLSAVGGRPDLAFDIVNQRTYPGWGWMLENGATTLWEHLEFSDNVYSHNHPMFGSVSEWLYRTVAGINHAQDAVAFNRIIIRPQPLGGLTWAKGSYESVRGRIASGWRIEDGTFRLSVEIPCNATALIHVPAVVSDDVTESGVPAGSSPGVSFAGMENGCAVYAVGSGKYEFVSVMMPSAPNVR